MNERMLLKIISFIGIALFPTVFRKQPIKDALLAFLLNAFANIFVAKYLTVLEFLSYPTRLAPRVFKSSIVYDYLFCPLFSVWYCQSTAKSSWKGIVAKAFLFATPQTLIEHLLERKTTLIKYHRGWTWLHSFITIALAKMLVRSILVGINKINKNTTDPKQSEDII